MSGDSTISIAPEVMVQMSQIFMQAIEDSGLVLVERNAAKFSYKYNQERSKVLKLKWVTAHQIQKYDLLAGVKSHQTVKNMVDRGQVPTNDYLYEKRKSLQVLKISMRFIKQYNS